MKEYWLVSRPLGLLIPIIIMLTFSAAWAEELPCEPSVSFVWEPTNYTGLSAMKSRGFDFKLGQNTLDRLAKTRIESALESLEKRKQTATESQIAAFRKRVERETAGLQNRIVCFNAFRVDLKFVDIEVIDVVETIDGRVDIKQGVKITKEGEKEGAVVVDYTPAELLEDQSFRNNTMALFNAGWSEGISVPVPLGFLKTGSIPSSERHQPNLSALLCLERVASATRNISFFMSQNDREFAFETWYFDPQSDIQRDLNEDFKKCDQALQVGPRIVELDATEFLQFYRDELKCIADSQSLYPDQQLKVSICESSLVRTPRIRSVIASDLGDESGFVYFVTTSNTVSLFDVQHMFLSGNVLGADMSSFWAVNLAGGQQAFHYVSAKDGPPLEYNTSVSTSSALRLSPSQ